MIYIKNFATEPVIELKAGKFNPAHSGQLKFYITAVNKLIKKEHHAPTIGICLCENKNEVVAEFSLEGINEPMVISQYGLGEALTQHLKIIREGKQPLIEKELEILG